MKLPVIAAALLSLSACGDLSRVMSFESTVHSVTSNGQAFRVFEHASEDAIMTTPSLGRIAADGALLGVTLDTAQVHAKAARDYLDQTNRKGCTVTRTQIVSVPQYEHFFTC